ncbi:RTC4 family protein [Aspergillus candidus]|uniref:Restriction of telomere capping protein 4 n=1 Tax=Aspergillus candidus TaxID=41067 RepID=A0A2I2FMT6_ASPCN|nr:hypothetical protein BDW47DRAFT_43093 [Aspergillus candidus]PLB41942.1 hypothetical protein BDW47DRAFT_43093 [Aspergillus candidus]
MTRTTRQGLDSSHSRTYLTARNYPGPHLLSTFKPAKREEPATDEEPQSSTDEEIASDVSAGVESDGGWKQRRQRQPSGPTLEEKLAATRSSRRGTTESKSTSKSPGSSRKRSSRQIAYDAPDENDEDMIFSQHSQKKRKSVGYGSNRNRRSDWGPRASSFASRRSESPASGVGEGSKSTDNGATGSAGSAKKGPAFKVPRDIASSPPKRVEFKNPPNFPVDSTSSSSFAASSARDPPVFDGDDDDSPLSTPLSSASSDFLNELSQWGDMEAEMTAPEPPPTKTLRPEESLCPMCKQPVDPGLLLTFLEQPRQRIRDQKQFCESHQSDSAEKEWTEKRYPTIDWANFDERLEGHFADLERLLAPDSTSYYRNLLDSELKSGQAKNFRLTLDGSGLENMSCGYYGTRGAAKMLQAVTTRFSRKLRRLAADDNIVKKAGVVPYAQAVLVPELAMRLVKEDMGVDDDAARVIIRESIEIGEKVNFEPNDTVPIPAEEQGGMEIE